MKEAFQKKGVRISDLNGVKVYLDKDWVAWRASNTQPQIKVYVEAENSERFDELLKFAEEILNKYLK